jgi:hypothetical protein
MLKTVLKRLRSGILHSGFISIPQPAPQPPHRLRELLRAGRDLDILLINVRDFALLRELYGRDLAQEIENQLQTVLRRAVNERLRTSPTCMALEPGEYLLCWPSRGDDPRSQHDTAYEIKLIAQREANAHLLRWAGRELGLGFGCARHEGDAMGADANREARLFQAVGEARLRAKMRMDLSQLSLSSEFNAILHERTVRALFQPIADFSTGTIMAWEALRVGRRAARSSRPPCFSTLPSKAASFSPWSACAAKKPSDRLEASARGKSSS